MREEMNRTLRFFKWKAGRWRERATARVAAYWLTGKGELPTPEHAEGLKAYAERQVSICLGLHDAFQEKWSRVPHMIELAKQEISRPELIFQRRAKIRARVLKYSGKLRGKIQPSSERGAAK